MTDVRDELRQVEARVSQLREENAALSRKLVKPTFLRNWTLGVVFGALALGSGGFLLADHAASVRSAPEAERNARLHLDEMNRIKVGTLQCKLSLQGAENELAKCVTARTGSPPTHMNRPPCRCEPGDPLCSCL